MDKDNHIVVAMLACAEGNESIGTEWTEVGLFTADTPLAEVLDWAQLKGGRTMQDRVNGQPRARLTLRYADDQRATGAPNNG